MSTIHSAKKRGDIFINKLKTKKSLLINLRDNISQYEDAFNQHRNTKKQKKNDNNNSINDDISKTQKKYICILCNGYSNNNLKMMNTHYESCCKQPQCILKAVQNNEVTAEIQIINNVDDKRKYLMGRIKGPKIEPQEWIPMGQICDYFIQEIDSFILFDNKVNHKIKECMRKNITKLDFNYDVNQLPNIIKLKHFEPKRNLINIINKNTKHAEYHFGIDFTHEMDENDSETNESETNEFKQQSRNINIDNNNNNNNNNELNSNKIINNTNINNDDNKDENNDNDIDIDEDISNINIDDYSRKAYQTTIEILSKISSWYRNSGGDKGSGNCRK